MQFPIKLFVENSVGTIPDTKEEYAASVVVMINPKDYEILEAGGNVPVVNCNSQSFKY